MRTVLFVDDEPWVLAGLQRLMRSEREQWSVLLAESGAAALDLLATTPVDVVFSDLRMPDMDGNTLLSQVAAVRPQALRVLLTGSILDGTENAAQHVLAKPCSKEGLMAILALSSNQHLGGTGPPQV